MRILMLTSSYLPKINGVTRTVSTIADGLTSRGHNVVVLTKWCAGEPREGAESLTKVIRVGREIRFGESAYFYGAMTLFTIHSCIKRESEVVHAHGTIPAISALFGWLLARTPFVISFHQDALIGWGTGYNRLNGIRYHFTRFLQARVCNFASFVTVQSPAVGEITRRVLGIGNKTQLVVLPNPVNFSKFSMNREGEGVCGQNILFVGNLIKRKGIDVLLRSIAVVLTRFPHARLTIVGKGPERERLFALAEQLRISASVSFVNEVDEQTLVSLYRSASVVALSSYSEVFGMVLVEALAASKPVVATATVGALSILTDGVSGRVVPIGDWREMGGAINEILSNAKRAREMARAGHAIALSTYSLEAVMKTLEDLYRTAVSQIAHFSLAQPLKS